MEQIEQFPEQSVGYFFLKSKDVHDENGCSFITFFARLAKEIRYEKEGKIQEQVQTVWVDIEEVMLEKASPKAKALPNGMQRYELTPTVFHSLYQVSQQCPEELFTIIPYHRESSSERFIP